MPAIKRKGFLRFITEGKGGASAGKLELIKTNFVIHEQHLIYENDRVPAAARGGQPPKKK